MKFASYFFFFAYVGLVVIAGFWGAFINPRFDFLWLFHLNTEGLADYARINMISQYRFLRGIELGYGLFALLFFKPIFHEIKFNWLFLLMMGLGTAGRIVSVVADGPPSSLMYFFLFFELVGIVVISLYSFKNLYQKNHRRE